MPTRLEKAKDQLAKAEARVQRLDARAKAQQRKDETRRKIVAGAVVLSLMREYPDFGGWFEKVLNERVMAKRDRGLFGF